MSGFTAFRDKVFAATTLDDAAVTLWDRFKLDLKERFLTFDALKGLFRIPACIVGLYVSAFYTQYILQAIGFLFFTDRLLDGLYQLFSNQIKKAAIVDQLVKVRKKLNTLMGVD